MRAKRKSSEFCVCARLWQRGRKDRMYKGEENKTVRISCCFASPKKQKNKTEGNNKLPSSLQISKSSLCTSQWIYCLLKAGILNLFSAGVFGLISPHLTLSLCSRSRLHTPFERIFLSTLLENQTYLLFYPSLLKYTL